MVRRRYTGVSEVFKVAQREMDKWIEGSPKRIDLPGRAYISLSMDTNAVLWILAGSSFQSLQLIS
jgi:hypothetical protein